MSLDGGNIQTLSDQKVKNNSQNKAYAPSLEVITEKFSSGASRFLDESLVLSMRKLKNCTNTDQSCKKQNISPASSFNHSKTERKINNIGKFNQLCDSNSRSYMENMAERRPLRRSFTTLDMYSSSNGFRTHPQLSSIRSNSSLLFRNRSSSLNKPAVSNYASDKSRKLHMQDLFQPISSRCSTGSDLSLNQKSPSTLSMSSPKFTFNNGQYPFYESQFSSPGNQCCQHCQLNTRNSCMNSNDNLQYHNNVPSHCAQKNHPQEHCVPYDDSTDGLTWRRLHMSRAKLKATATTSELLSGFAMVAMVELQINEPTDVPEWLFIMFSVCTTVLVAVHIFALMISTYLLPNIDAISKLQSTKLVEESPHERMKGFVELAWAFSTVLGLFLFLVELAILCWVKFWDFSIRAAMAATIIVIPVLIVFILFVLYFYRSLVVHKCKSSLTDINELEQIKKKLDDVSNA